MRIVRSRVDELAAPFPRPLRFQEQPMLTNTAVVIHLEDQAGAVGFGYAPTFGFGTAALRSLIEDDLAPLLLRVDLEEVSDGIRALTDAAGIAGRPAGLARQAIATIETALWDLAGQLAGEALHALWGQPTVSVRAYVSGGWRHLSVDELADQARAWADSGFEAMKLQVGLSPAEDIARVRAVRDAVGPDIGIMLDANQRLPVLEAEAWAAGLAPFDPTWLEEPIAAESHARLATLRASCAIPIAAGESETEPCGLEDLQRCRAVDIIQPDVHRVGLNTARDVQVLASRNETVVAPHMAYELSAQLVAGGDGWLEYFDWFDDWWESPTLPTNGRVTPSSTPGHGLRLRPGWLETHRV